MFYKDWQKRDTVIKLRNGVELKVKKTRTGWRHINYRGRGMERIHNSLQFLSIAEKIILSDKIQPVRLGDKEMLNGGKWVKIGLRARVKVDKTTIKKVQVVLLAVESRVEKTRECEFFSIHVLK